MPFGLQSIADEFFADPLFRLTKTTRPYFLQSRTLVLACRQLPDPPSDATAQIRDLRRLFKKVEGALYLGTRASREHQIENADEAFKAADEYLRAYTAKYAVTLQPAPDTDEVAKEGWMIKKIKGPAVALLESLKPLPKVTLSIVLWPEKPRRRGNGGWFYAGSTIDVQIEKSASLNVLLHRLLWAKAADNALERFSLKQNPQFYEKFPDKKVHFRPSDSRPDVHAPINALCLRDPVKKYEARVLHLIIDRDGSDREIQLKDHCKLHLPEIYGNGWHLDDVYDSIVVREKGGMHRLLLWDVKLPPVLLVDDSSPLTPFDLEVPELYPGLTAEGLDKEWELLPASSEMLDRIEGHQTEHDLNDLPERSEEIPVPQDGPEDGVLTPTLANDELSVSLRAWELHDNSVQGNRYSCPRYPATESPGNSLIRTNVIPSEPSESKQAELPARNPSATSPPLDIFSTSFESASQDAPECFLVTPNAKQAVQPPSQNGTAPWMLASRQVVQAPYMPEHAQFLARMADRRRQISLNSSSSTSRESQISLILGSLASRTSSLFSESSSISSPTSPEADFPPTPVFIDEWNPDWWGEEILGSCRIERD